MLGSLWVLLLSILLVGLQLLANTAWSRLFFEHKQSTATQVDIVIMLGLTTLAIGIFVNVNMLATWLVVPYWLWVALTLHASILRLHRAKAPIHRGQHYGF